MHSNGKTQVIGGGQGQGQGQGHGGGVGQGDKVKDDAGGDGDDDSFDGVGGSDVAQEDDNLSEGEKRKKVILAELAVINQRLEMAMETLANRNYTYDVHIQENANDEIFPKGIGLAMLSDVNATDDAESILVLRQLIANIPSLEIQDGLLNFLSDYVVQSKIVEKLTHERMEILKSVADWLATDGDKLKEIRPVGVDAAVDAEDSLGECCLQTIGMLQNMAALKKQLTVFGLARKSRVLTDSTELSNADADSMSSMGDSDDGGSGGGTSGPVFSGSSKPTIELQDVLFTIRDESNEELMSEIETKLDNIGEVIFNRESEIKKARANIRKKQEDKEKLQREIDDMKTQNEQLAVKVRELNEQREAQRAAKKAAEMAQRSSVPTEDFCCQVNIENLQKKSQDSDSRRKSIVRRTPRPDLPKEPDSRTTSAATPEDKDRPTPTPSTPSSNSQRNSITPSSSSPNQKKDSLTRSAQGGTPKGSNAGTTRRSKQSLSAKQPAEEKEGEGEEKESKGGRKKRSLMEFAGPTEEPTEVSAAVGMSVKRKQNQKKDMLSTSTSPSPSPWDGESSSGSSEITLKCPSDGPLKIPDDQLEQLFRSHITNLLGVAQPLLDQLLDLRRNARLEIRKIKDRVNAIGALEKKIAKFLDVAPEDRETLPVIELNVDRTNMTVTHRSPQPHRCPLCYCRETTTSSLDVTVLNQKAMLEKSLEMSKAYQNVLKDMRDTYSHVCSTPMVEGQKIVKTLLSQLVWGELGTSDYSNLDEEFDDEMESAVEGAQEVPEGLQDLVKHAVYVTDIVRTLVRDLAKILRNDKIRMDCVKKQDKYLSQLETAMGNARTYMDDTAVHLTRVRAGTDFLKNVMVLAMSKCFCCKCYNSALDDGTRIVPDTTDAKKDHEMNLSRNMALLQQALGAIVRNTDEPDTLAIGVEEEVIGDLKEAQTKLTEALDCLDEDEG